METGSVEVLPNRSKLVTLFAAAGALSVALTYIPYGRYILYPFALLSTWAHEMGHGLAAILVGGRFFHLELYSNLGGVALINSGGRFAQLIVSAGGLVGPAFLGALIMILGSKSRTAPYVLSALTVAIAISLVFWIRNLFGFVAMSLLGAALAAFARYANSTLRILLTQLIAVQLGLSAWTNRSYLFIKEFERDGKTMLSDTGLIQEALFLPYWFWGALLGLTSLLILLFGFWFAWIRSASDTTSTRIDV